MRVYTWKQGTEKQPLHCKLMRGYCAFQRHANCGVQDVSCNINAFYVPINHVADLSGNNSEKVMFPCRDWRISIQFTCFCFKMSFTIMIDGSIKRNRQFGFELQSSCVVEKRYN